MSRRVSLGHHSRTTTVAKDDPNSKATAPLLQQNTAAGAVATAGSPTIASAAANAVGADDQVIHFSKRDAND